MIKIPLKDRKHISAELKRFNSIVNGLNSKGKASSEDDARIVLNDMLSYILGYDKYKELVTEQRERNGRLDYVVKLEDGPYAKKKDKIDFVIEAKAIHQDLQKKYVDQTLSYCLTTNTQYFLLTNVREWHLYKVIPAKKKDEKPQAEKIFELDFSNEQHMESLVDDFYIFSRSAYLSGCWETVANQQKAANVEDILTILLSDKMLQHVEKHLRDIHGVKVDHVTIKDIIENKIANSDIEINRSLLRKLNSKPQKEKQSATKKEVEKVDEKVEEATEKQECSCTNPSDNIQEKDETKIEHEEQIAYSPENTEYEQ